MGASLFVGRVGGLAVALGVGAAMFSGSGLAWADSGSRSADSAGASNATESSASPAARNQPSARRANPGASRGAATRNNDLARTASPQLSARSITAPVAGAARRAAALAVVDPEPATDSVAADDFTVVPPAVELPESAGPDIRVHIDPTPDPVEAYEVTAFLSEAGNDVSDGADTDPLVPADPLASGELLAFVRRNTLALANSNAVAPQVTSSATATSGSLTVDPTVEFDNGIIFGTLQATSAAGNKLTYTVLGGSCGDGCGVATSGGKLTLGVLGKDAPQSYAILPYANWLDGGTKGLQQFQVRVSEVTDFDSFLTNIPLVGLLAAPIIDLLQKTPFLSDLLAPIIGSSLVAAIDVNVGTLASGDTPVAYTYKVASFDGTLISTNFFPASGLQVGDLAPSVFNGPGLGGAGGTNPYAVSGTSGLVPGLAILRDAGYDVVTWDPRGEFQSGGILQLDSPMYEGRDVSALITWAAENTPAELDGGDPLIGMVGGSYGGGIQLATVDPRIDAIAPGIAWNSLNEALYPTNIFKTAWANTLALALLTTGARINTQIYEGIITGDLFGFISETAQAVLGSSGPTALLNTLDIPALFIQGTVDALFPLLQAVENVQAIVDGLNPFGQNTKMIWFCGGHGICLDPPDPEQYPTLYTDTIAWLNKYVRGATIPIDLVVPNFQWWDQTGTRYQSDLFPFDPAFNQADPLMGTSAGGLLGILPFAIGGSGPNTTNCEVAAGCSFPLNQVFATPAGNALNIPITGVTAGQQVVGAPTVSFTYSGLGTSKAVYGQIIDGATGRVLGNIVTPIPLTLDGQSHTVSAPLADIAYTAGTSPSLTLQITSSASLYWNSSWGLVNITNVEADLPVRA